LNKMSAKRKKTVCSAKMRPTMIFFRMSLVVLLVSAVSAQTDSSREALFAAIHRGAVDDLAHLLESGVNPNIVGADGTAALMAAPLFANARTVDLLLQHGADPNRVGVWGTTSLMWAIPDAYRVRLLLARCAIGKRRSGSWRT